MADIKQNVPADGIGRQEEEVRDLFNLLTKSTPAEKPQETVPTAQEPIVEESAPVQEPVAEEIAVEESVSVQEPVVEIEEPVAEEFVAEIEGPVEEPVAEQPAPKESAPPPFEGRERRAFVVDDEDEDDIGLELPPLILTSYDEEDEDEADEFNDYDQFVLSGDGDEEDYEVDEAPTQRRNPLKLFWNALRGNVPLPCDSKPEIARKSVFWLSVLVIVGALTYILYNVWWLPAFTKGMYDDLSNDYHSELVGVVEQSGYPQEMQLSFKTLYERNNEVRGWLSFHAKGNRDFLDIEYPIMYSGDNDKYLTIDFNGNKNKNGALFFDMRANLTSPEDTNDSLIVYGHNMASGQMLAGLNKFIGNVNNARVAPTMTMNTLFANGEYKVFAVVITDESAQSQYYYNVRRTQFADDEDYLTYIENLRARSLFDYPVDVQAWDELLLLSTCTVPSSAKIDNGRLTVIARKVRPGESAAVNTAAIVKNDDVIMPYAWYTRQKKQPHAFYSGGMILTTTTSSATSGSNVDWGGTTDYEEFIPLPTGDVTSATTLPTGTDATSTTVAPVGTTQPSSTSASSSATSSSSSSATSSSATSSSATSASSTTESTTTATTTTESTTTATTTAAEGEPPAQQE